MELKKIRRLALVFLSVSFIVLPAAAVSAETPLIPRRVLFGNAEKTRPQLSPDGKKLAYLAPYNSVLNIWLRELNGSRKDRPVTREANAVGDFYWASDSRHLLYLQDSNGDENWHLYDKDIHTGVSNSLTPFDGVRVEILELSKKNPREILITMNKKNPDVFDAYRFDLKQKLFTLVAENPGNAGQWFCDKDLKVRGMVTARKDGGNDVWTRPNEKSDWVKLASWNYEDERNSFAVTFSDDGESVYIVESAGNDTARLVAYGAAGGSSREVLAADDSYDVSEVLLHPDTRRPQMAAVLKERLQWLVLDPSIREDIDTLKKMNPGDFNILNRDKQDRLWLVRFREDRRSSVYYLYDRKTRRAEFLFSESPDLEGYQLAAVRPFTYEARDGLTIHGYKTAPVGREDEPGLPAVLLVHGGPWSRDVWGYYDLVQWLANRGYLVLQVNYRGSAGYGKKFLNAGDKEWGGKMQDDLSDAVRWAVQKRWADPARIAIFGRSYGGYAALAGAAFTPNLFRCAVDLAGPSNLLTFMETLPTYWAVERAALHRRIGNPATEPELLKQRSPYFGAVKIKIPVLIVQGANDPRVKKEESEQIVSVMREHGLDVEYLLFEDEGHHLEKPENRLKFYAAAERFLAKHLGGRYEPEERAA